MAAALVKGSEKKFGATADFLPPAAIQIATLQQLNPLLPNRYIAGSNFLPVEPLFLVQTYQGSEGANENRRVLNMNMCFIDLAKLSTEHFCFLRTQCSTAISENRSRQSVCCGFLPVHMNICGVWLITYSFNLSFLIWNTSNNVYVCKSIDPSIWKGLIFVSTDMTSLGAILVICKLEGLTRREGGSTWHFPVLSQSPFSVLCGRCGFPFPIVALSSLISPHFVSAS